MSKLFSFSIYYLSFLPLWVAVIIRDWASMHYSETDSNLWTERIGLCLIGVFLVVTTLIALWGIKNNASFEQTYRLDEVTPEKTLTADYLLVYIIPLMAFDFSVWYDAIIFVLLWGMFGWLSVKYQIFSIVLIWEFFGFRIYKCDLFKELRSNSDTDGEPQNVTITRTVISRDRLEERLNQEITVQMFNNTYGIVKKNTH